ERPSANRLRRRRGWRAIADAAVQLGGVSPPPPPAPPPFVFAPPFFFAARFAFAAFFALLAARFAFSATATPPKRPDSDGCSWAPLRLASLSARYAASQPRLSASRSASRAARVFTSAGKGL